MSNIFEVIKFHHYLINIPLLLAKLQRNVSKVFANRSS